MTEKDCAHQTQTVASDLTDELVILATDLAYRRESNPNVGGASAILAGLTLLLREAKPADVSEWLKGIATEIERTGQLPKFDAQVFSRVQ